MYIDSEVDVVYVICPDLEAAQKLCAAVTWELEDHRSDTMSRTTFKFFGLKASRRDNSTTVLLVRGPELSCGIDVDRRRFR